MKAIIWGSCGSHPCPASSTTIRGKVKAALWAARNQHFSTEAQLDAFLDQLPHSNWGTYKANTSCVQIEADGTDVILCDAGTGMRDFAAARPADTSPQTYHIFISHLHWDHIQGFPFFKPAYERGNRIIFHGFHPEIEHAIRRQMTPPYFPVPFAALQADIEFDIREEGQSFEVGEVTITSIKQDHPGDSWGYRFEHHGKSIIYSSDSEHGPESKQADYHFVDFFRDADILIFDGQYTLAEASTTKRNWGHSDHITAVELSARAKVKQLVISHHEPSYTDREIEQMHAGTLEYYRSYNQQHNPQSEVWFPNHIAIAYDGLVIEA
jgi:phosphoribosyl 1,2-cyclic phosphodiesterase